MSDPIYRVMISSTTRDLPAHRQAAKEAVERADMKPEVMETGTASTADPLGYSLGMVRKSEIYVGVFGFRYGHVPDDPARNPDRRSITELEYREAMALKRHVLIFIMDNAHPVPVSVGELATFYEDDDDKKARLERLKKELQDKHRVAFFKSAEELKTLILQAVINLRAEGIVDLPDDDSPPIADPDDPHIPKPPAPHIAHPYRLSNKFFGRATELDEIDAWAESGDPTLVIEAIGGVGKSALTWRWVNERASKHGFDGILWWSFYSDKGTMTNFVRHALAYLTGRRVTDLRDANVSAYQNELIDLLKDRRILFVFDGIERIFVAYASHDAPSRLDEDVSSEQRVRKCLEPKEGDFLRRLAEAGRVKLLVSSRLFPADLENRANRPIPCVRHKKLDGLHPDDALALMRHHGIRGDEAALRRFMKKFDYHSLLLNVVAGVINDYPPAPGDFDAWYADEGQHLSLQELDLKQSRTEILHYALRGLSEQERTLLARIAAFRYPVRYDAVQAINPYAPSRPQRVPKPGLFSTRQQIEDWDTYQAAVDAYPNLPEVKAAEQSLRIALKKLRERGLLQWSEHERAGQQTTVFDLHPVVRAYALENLEGDAARAAYLGIRDHFEAIPPVPLDEVHDLADLQRDIQIYDALIHAGLLDDASDFYGRRLSEVLEWQLSAYPLIIELLSPLFTNGLDAPPALSTATRRSNRVTGLAAAYSYTGQQALARTLKELKLKIDLDDRDAVNLGVGLTNYGNTLRALNNLAGTECAHSLSPSLAEAAEDANGLAMAHLALLGFCRDTGQWDAAETEYVTFTATPPAHDTDFWRADGERCRAEMRFYRGEDAGEALETAWTLALKSKAAVTQRALLWLRGEIALRAGDAKAAETHFADAFKRAQAANSADTANNLGCLARARLALDQPDEARRLIKEALALPNSDEVHNLYNSAAEVYLGLGEHVLAQDYALKAYESAWADGPPYSWWYDLERAKKTLAALGVPEPSLPPFDPSKVEKIAYEDEIVAFIEALKAKKAAENDAEDED